MNRPSFAGAIYFNRENKIKKQGFTFIELVMVIVILEILATMLLTRLIDLQYQARASATRRALGVIRTAVAITYVSNAAYGITPFAPTTIDAAMFQDNTIPIEPIDDVNTMVVTSCAVAANASAGGWWYDSSTGKVWVNNSQYTNW